MIAAGSAVGFFRPFIHHCTLSAAAMRPGLGMQRKGVVINHTLLQNEAYIEDIRTRGVMILTPFGKGVGITDIMHQGSRVASLSDK